MWFWQEDEDFTSVFLLCLWIICRVASILTTSTAERLLLPQVFELCSDMKLFEVGRGCAGVCTMHFGDICHAVGQEATEKILLEFRYYLPATLKAAQLDSAGEPESKQTQGLKEEPVSDPSPASDNHILLSASSSQNELSVARILQSTLLHEDKRREHLSASCRSWCRLTAA
ncbi:uncharacterized protein LOC117703469 isoform X2 [Arvicanthis niloticus]|uniref:uncharacterized protein LOC117703469 isoform X2 n=1 Tax=Arvicanthis niloticus TaxID=61156 RepID=UPI00402BCA6A